MTYLLRHWRGEQSLFWSFWINLVLLRLIVFGLQGGWTGVDGERRGMPRAFVVFAVLLVHGALFVWQAVGVIRASDVYAEHSGSRATAMGAQLGIVGLLLLTLSYALAGYQTTLAPLPAETFAERMARERAATYTLDVVDEGRELRLSGLVALGATARLRAELDARPGINRVVLDSVGGNVYEARGLARLFRERGLVTRVERVCASACAVAFIGGERREIGRHARFGLHGYRLDAAHAIIATDPESEQARDRALYANAGVEIDFVDRMFDAPSDAMWWPAPEELLRAGVVHEIVR